MNCLSLNICTTRTFTKRSWVKSICIQNEVSFLRLQETLMTQVDLFKICSMWGTYKFDFAFNSARGHSGGILSI